MEIDRETAERECDRLNREIMQYLEEYQTVRNMMYGVTVSILALNGAFFDNYYLFLLPLIVILPSYIILYDYWRCVVRASSYLRVFYPELYPWEYRNLQKEDMLEKLHLSETGHSTLDRKLPDRIFSFSDEGTHVQQLPYIICAAACILLFACSAVSAFYSNQQADVSYIVTGTDGTQLTVEMMTDSSKSEDSDELDITPFLDAALFVVLILVSFLIFRRFWKVEHEPFMAFWEDIKQQEC